MKGRDKEKFASYYKYDSKLSRMEKKYLCS